MKKESYFDGGLLSFIGHSIVAFFIIALTLEIATNSTLTNDNV